MKNGTVLIIEDDRAQLVALGEFLEGQGFEVLMAETPEKGIKMVTERDIDVVITDLRMPGKDGIAVLEEVKRINPEIGVLIMTAYGEVTTAVSAMKKGAFDYLTKPLDLDEVELLVRRAIENRKLKAENRELRERISEKYKFDNIVYVSSTMDEVLNRAMRAANSKATVLIYGESGTGKELIARAIHYASPRREKPLVTVNCASLNPNLFESELFGHEKGAFTGADRMRKGRIEEANGGTIFLDEVGDIPMDLQVKLLRFLQEGEFERVGSNVKMRVDVRVIAATNRNLQEMVNEGRFRLDLFYRLSVITIEVPPLRERKVDIPPLVSYFIRKFAMENNKDVTGISKEAMDALLRYNYPGNVRELENAIEHAVVMTRDKVIIKDDLPLHIANIRVEGEIIRQEDRYRLEERKRELEERMIREALNEAKGNQSKAAALLGISERKLRYKLKKYKIK